MKHVYDWLSWAAAVITLIIIIFASSSLINGRLYDDDIPASWDDITETFHRWEYGEPAKNQDVQGEKQFSSDHSKVIIHTVSGSVKVTGWQEDYYLVVYDRSSISQEHMADAYADIAARNNKIEILTQYRPNIPGIKGSIEYTVFVPESCLEISVNTISGAIQMDSIHNHTAVHISMVSSNVSVSGGSVLKAFGFSSSIDFTLDGSHVHIETVSGSVFGNLKRIDQDKSVIIKTSAGDITLILPEDAHAKLHGLTETGSISYPENFHELQMSDKKQEVRGILGDGGAAINLESVEGNITISIQ